MVSGIILASGAVQGMRPRNKALLPCDGETLLNRQIRVMSELCPEIIIVTDSPKSYMRLVNSSVRIVSNYRLGSGLLGGLAAGLSLSQHRYAWVVGGDMTSLSSAAARLMLMRLIDRRGTEAVWPSDRKGLNPIHGLYDCECAPRIAALVEEETATLVELPRYLEWAEVTEDEFVQLGIACDFLETPGSVKVSPFASLEEEFRTQMGF